MSSLVCIIILLHISFLTIVAGFESFIVGLSGLFYHYISNIASTFLIIGGMLLLLIGSVGGLFASFVYIKNYESYQQIVDV